MINKEGGSFVITEDQTLVKVEGTEPTHQGKSIYVEKAEETTVDDHSHDQLHDDPPSQHDQIKNAISTLNVDNGDLWLSDGKPKTSAISDIVGFNVTAAERDAAWDEVKSS